MAIDPKNIDLISSITSKLLTQVNEMLDSAHKRNHESKTAEAHHEVELVKLGNELEAKILEKDPNALVAKLKLIKDHELELAKLDHSFRMEELKVQGEVDKISIQSSYQTDVAFASILGKAFEPVGKILETACSVVGKIDADRIVNRMIDHDEAQNTHRRNLDLVEKAAAIEAAKKTAEDLRTKTEAKKTEEPKNGASKIIDTPPAVSGNIGKM